MTDDYALSGPGGTITVSAGALATIVQRAAEREDGVRLRRRRRGLDVRVEDGRARVELGLAAPYGAVLPDLARGVQQRVAEALGGMCGLDVDAVDVTVEELEGA
jgi:uncharacterized alkaline shock family protein YloU